MNEVRVHNQKITDTAQTLAKISAWMLVGGIMVPTSMLMTGRVEHPESLAFLAFTTVPLSIVVFWCGWRMLGRLRDE